MPSKFDEYLEKGGFSNEDRKAAQVEKVEDIAREQSPSDLQNSYTPDPKDAGKQDRAGQEATVEAAGQTLKDQGAEIEGGMQTKDSLAKYAQSSQHTPKEPEQEQEL